LAKRGQKYVVDSTNLEADVMRNKVRLQVLPLLRELNPAVSDNIQRTAENLAEAQLVLNAEIASIISSKILELSDLEKYGSSEYLAFEWLKQYGFNGNQVRQILDAETGRIVTSSMGYDVLKDRGRLIVEPMLEPFNPMRIPEEGTYVLGCSSIEFGDKTTENNTFQVQKKSVYVSKEPYIATLDAAKVQFPLTIRRVEEGDWMQPYGMKGKKLLSDLMTDLKMTVFEKRHQLVVADNQGVVLWLVGLRTDQRVAVDEQTSVVLELHLD
jgi:tRNA(Ile)-lysidine synthase